MPIYIGVEHNQKMPIVQSYMSDKNLSKVVSISDANFFLDIEYSISYDNCIKYVNFYKLLQDIDNGTLVIINECLRTQNRHGLTYNCIRNFLNQTQHQIIFNTFPQIDKQDDFMTLFDFDTKSRWKRERFNIDLVRKNSDIFAEMPNIHFDKESVPTRKSTKKSYARKKKNLFNNLGNSNPHILPRRLLLLAGKDKVSYIDSNNLPLFGNTSNRMFIARNKRLKHPRVTTYRELDTNKRYNILEFEHKFIDFSNCIRRLWQFEFDVLVTDLKVDQWYFKRYSDWSKRLNETCASLR